MPRCTDEVRARPEGLPICLCSFSMSIHTRGFSPQFPTCTQDSAENGNGWRTLQQSMACPARGRICVRGVAPPCGFLRDRVGIRVRRDEPCGAYLIRSQPATVTRAGIGRDADAFGLGSFGGTAAAFGAGAAARGRKPFARNRNRQYEGQGKKQGQKGANCPSRPGQKYPPPSHDLIQCTTVRLPEDPHRT